MPADEPQSNDESFGTEPGVRTVLTLRPLSFQTTLDGATEASSIQIATGSATDHSANKSDDGFSPEQAKGDLETGLQAVLPELMKHVTSDTTLPKKTELGKVYRWSLTKEMLTVSLATNANANAGQQEDADDVHIDFIKLYSVEDIGNKDIPLGPQIKAILALMRQLGISSKQVRSAPGADFSVHTVVVMKGNELGWVT
jgi:hypothetical protein